MDLRRLLIMAVFGILGIVALEGLMAHATGTIVAQVEEDRQAWNQTADACLAVIRRTGAPPRGWEDLAAPGPKDLSWTVVRKRVRLDFRYSTADLRRDEAARQAWITLIRPGPLDLAQDRRRVAEALAALP